MKNNYITPYSTYLLSRYSSNITEIKKCECCGVSYGTNINRTRCSKKCSKIMKYRRAKNNKKLNKFINEIKN